MRTVTFADPKVVDLLNERYVVVWNNHSQDRTAKGPQPVYTREEMAAYPEGGGGTNLYTMITSPDGVVLNVLTGFWSAGTLLDELEFCRGLTPENRATSQAARRTALRQEAAKLQTDFPEEARKRPKESATVRRMAALQLLAGCHEQNILATVQAIDEYLVSISERSRARMFV
jgi:hypothetical protein